MMWWNKRERGWFQFEFYFSSNFRLSSEKIFVFFFSSFSRLWGLSQNSSVTLETQHTESTLKSLTLKFCVLSRHIYSSNIRSVVTFFNDWKAMTIWWLGQRSHRRRRGNGNGMTSIISRGKKNDRISLGWRESTTISRDTRWRRKRIRATRIKFSSISPPGKRRTICAELYWKRLAWKIGPYRKATSSLALRNEETIASGWKVC